MREISKRLPPKCLPLVLLFVACASLQFFLGSCAVESSSSRAQTGIHSSAASRGNTGTRVIIVLVGLVIVVLFCFLLFKFWQKKKRDEQYARLLKLFEEDDELEVELGLRD